MCLRGQKTTTSYVKWEELMKLILKLQRDREYKFSLLIAIGAFTGLRISDILSLSWEQLLDQNVLMVIEKKTKKSRKIKLNEELQGIVTTTYQLMGDPEMDQFVFINRYGTKTIRIQYVNAKLKELFMKYNIKTANASSHTLRKSFGRRVWENNNYSERSLVLLSEIFNHSSVQITKRYLGIREEEIFDVYDSLGL